jgi:acetylornithine deacetylase/succinyl-diaminopimelate desuccinylase-like protein
VDALAYARVNSTRFVADLKRLVSFPSVGAEPRQARAVTACADWLAARLQTAGLEDADVIPTPGHPIVRARWRGARGRPTVLLYGHYDVQPPEPLDAWRTPPFQPRVVAGYLYGRGASDDKGPLLAHVSALEAYLRGPGVLPVNVECVFEGEEESGSTHLGHYLRTRAPHADVALISDTRMRGRDRPAITYALRGAVSAEIELDGAPHELHSGQFGGAVANPLETVCRVVAGLRGPHGRIAIDGFYDRVRTATAAERGFMQRSGPRDEEILREAGVATGAAEPGYTLYEQTTLRPSLTVSGIAGGYAGPGVKGAVPSRAVAKLGFRLVPDQDPRDVERLLRRHLARAEPAARVRLLSCARPVLLDVRHPALAAAARSCKRSFGTHAAFLRSGGTIPVVSLFDELLGVPTVLLGLALPDDGMHAPNERFLLENFLRGIETSIRFLAELGRAGHASVASSPRPRQAAGVAG